MGTARRRQVRAVFRRRRKYRILHTRAKGICHQREVLILRYWSGLSEREIAQALDISPGSVKSAASRGMATLTRVLGESHE